jgi:hypothetical protein
MKSFAKKIIDEALALFGYKLIKNGANYDPIIDNDESFKTIYNACQSYTMTSKERMYSLFKAVEYIIKAKIDGDFVECGVWKGGSSMLIALTLKHFNTIGKKIYLYDTFEGMSEPTDADFLVQDHSVAAKEKYYQKKMEDVNSWCLASLLEVEDNMRSTGYPLENIVFIKGKVEKRIPEQMPNRISLLRLDTDWYESTKHELMHLYPILTNGGVLIIDDYGHWAGSKKAVDEYFFNKSILLNRIDYTARISVKYEN